MALQVTGAVAINERTVEVTFNEALAAAPDPGDIANYSIPGITILHAVWTTATTVRLYSADHTWALYTVTVANIQGNPADPLDPLAVSADFTGYTPVPKYVANAQGRRKLQLVWDVDMLPGAALINAANYTVTSTAGAAVAVASVTANVFGGATRRVTLLLAGTLIPGLPYLVRVGTAVLTLDGRNTVPDVVPFVWAEGPMVLRVPLSRFSPSTAGGLLSNSRSLAYFSPALDTAQANAALQVDDLSVCTRANDVYTMPNIPDPEQLHLNATSSHLNRETFYGPFIYTGGATYTLRDLRLDTYTTPVSGPCTATLTPSWDLAVVSVIGDPARVLFDGVSLTPFYLADLSGPLPPGVPVVTVLEP